MKISSILIDQEASLRKKIKVYKKVGREIQDFLSKHPSEWGRFQSQFNMEINGIFRDLMNFEKQCFAKADEDSIYKLKRIFVNHLRKDFIHGEYLNWSLNKPYGYAGDFKIIEAIYLNDPKTQGFERLSDNYFQMSSICVAVRNRKEDFKNIIEDTIKKSEDKIKIMDLAAGPCRDIYEILSTHSSDDKEIIFHCYENDDRAIDHGKKLLGNDPRATFFKQNAVRLALKKDSENPVEGDYDLIYSTGLFDYLDYRVSVRLIENLRKLLKPSGILAISDVRDKLSNPSIYFMEWVADWNLIYREDEEFRKIFLDAGFSERDLDTHFEQQGIMQYVLAKKNTA